MQVYIDQQAEPARIEDRGLYQRVRIVADQLPYAIPVGSSVIWGEDHYSIVVVSAIFSQMILHLPCPATPWFGAPLYDVLTESLRTLGVTCSINDMKNAELSKVRRALSKLREQQLVCVRNGIRELHVAVYPTLLLELLQTAENHLAVGN